MLLIYIIIGLVLFIGVIGIRIVRPTEKAVIETMGKYSGFAKPGFNWIVPLFQSMIQVNVTEQMSDIEPQEIITKDSLNANVDLVVFYKVKDDETSIKNSLYKVNDVDSQIKTLARTTARNVIGKMVFTEVNSERNTLNAKLAEVMSKETRSWGVEIVRVELKEITPPKSVQETMNKVIQAENEKDAAVNFAQAAETEADGKKRAAIKEAQGIAEGRKIVADATAYKVKVENEATRKYFKAEAQKFKQLEVAQEALKNNSKVILGGNTKDVLKLFDLNK